ncbi:MAG: VOC family protein [Bacteroidetes bacterium]|nr:VOC family protein [Bacteroidota bacterium]
MAQTATNAPYRIQGMQHIGVATSNMDHSLRFFRQLFGMDIPFFDSVQAAPLMDSHTRGETITKRASMVMNLQGGCAFEVLRADSFEPVKASWTLGQGDLGITTVQMKTRDIERMHAHAMKIAGDACDRSIRNTPWGQKTFYVSDPDENRFQVLEASDWFENNGHPSGGVLGCTIGVTNMEKSLELYANILGFDEVLFDETGTFADWEDLPNGKESFRRARLTQSAPGAGGFGPLTGRTYIELVQALDRKGRFIFEDRIWCDIGFAHLGFDVRGMNELGKALDAKHFGFRCDTADAIGMGETKVHCTYIDDPDECWLEMIEVHKVPIIEKWGLFLNVQKRGADEPLPRWMLKALRFSRIKDK